MTHHIKCIFAGGIVAAAMMAAAVGHAQSLKNSEILIIGDSQIAFGGGEVYLDYFSNLPHMCADELTDSEERLNRLSDLSVGVAGVRATSIDSWVARAGSSKEALCKPEKSLPVNVRGFGALKHPKKRFVQVGKDAAYPLCSRNLSGLESLFGTTNAKPALLVFSYLGFSVFRWLEEPETADKDAAALARQLPQDVPCVFMTSAPSFSVSVNRDRKRAEDIFIEAFSKYETQCRPVASLTEDVIDRFENRPEHFKNDPEGFVRDPYHPNTKGIGAFLKAVSPALCQAIESALLDARADNQ